MKAQTEGEPKLMSILILSDDLLTGTSIAGQEMVRREVDSVQSDWQSFTASCTQVRLPPSFSHSVFFFFFILFPLSGGVDVRLHTPPCCTVVHIISQQSLLFDVILYFVQPSSLRSSSLPSPLYFHYHCPPSYVVFFSSHHMPIPYTSTFFPVLSL